MLTENIQFRIGKYIFPIVGAITLIDRHTISIGRGKINYEVIISSISCNCYNILIEQIKSSLVFALCTKITAARHWNRTLETQRKTEITVKGVGSRGAGSAVMIDAVHDV